MPTQLDALRKYSAVDLDSLDVEVARTYGPFVNGTSNQIFVHAEAVRDSDSSRSLLRLAAKKAFELELDSTKRVVACTRIFTVLLSLRILPHLSGRSLIQTSMHEADSVTGTIRDALELVKLYKTLSPESEPVDTTKRVCIKIPSTWAGLQAARILKQEYQVDCLATTLFTLEQAAIAQQVGALFISPYVNELRVHFVEGAVDANPGFGLVGDIRKYYQSVQSVNNAEGEVTKTEIMPASLITTDEVLSLAGIDRITVTSALLAKLAETPDEPALVPTYTPNSDATESEAGKWAHLTGLAEDEARFKKAFRENDEASRKLDEAIMFFLSYERLIHEVVEKELAEVAKLEGNHF